MLVNISYKLTLEQQALQKNRLDVLVEKQRILEERIHKYEVNELENELVKVERLKEVHLKEQVDIVHHPMLKGRKRMSTKYEVSNRRSFKFKC